MKRRALAVVLAACGATALAAPAGGRDIIADVSRIVAPNGVQESFKLRIGGIDQWVYTRGQDRNNPVLLFVHGGPASPSAPTMWLYQRPLEEYFTVVNYDQRGAGRTYLDNDAEAVRPTLRIGQFVDDAVAIAQAIAERYGKRKVILAGHSWGTVVGMRAVLARPELFHAYVGIGQVINMLDNEQVSFDFAMAQARKDNNRKAIAELESIAPYPGNTPITRERIVKERTWAQHYGGLAAYRGDFAYYFNAPLLSPEYDEAAVKAIDKGSLLTLERVLKEWLAVDFKPVTSFPVPVVMFMGRHDYTTPSAPTDAWLSRVRAPYKKAVWFEHSAHLVQFEEPGKTLVSLLEYVRPLAAEAPACDAAGVKLVPAAKTLAQLALVSQHLIPREVSLLQGACAEAVRSVRMGRPSFEEGAHLAHPQLAGAEFIMAVNADRALNVGIWKTAEGYLLAAYFQRDDGFSAPVELLRSRQPLKSVTYFPAPDANAGKLGLLVSTDGGNAVIDLDWDHTALSRSASAKREISADSMR